MSTTTVSPNHSSSGKNKDKSRNIALAVVLPIVGIIIIGAVVAIVLYHLRKKKKQNLAMYKPLND